MIQSLALPRTAVFAVLATFVLAGCRSTAPTVSPIAARSPAERLELLRSVRNEGGSLVSLAKVTVTSGAVTRSFSSRIESDFSRVRMGVFSPLGTEMATVFLADGEAIVLDHHANTVWSGAPSELRKMPAAAPIARLSPETAASVLFAVVPSNASGFCDAADGFACVRSDEGSWEVSAAGVVSARAGEVTATYDPPRFPPARVSITSGATTLSVRHDEVARMSEQVSRPEIPSGYRRVASPGGPAE